MEQNENTVEVGHPITNMLMRQAQNADMGAADHADAAGPSLEAVTGPVTASGVSGHVTGEGDQVDQARAEGDELADHLLEIENLVEGARDAVVRRLEQFDHLDERTMRIEAMLLRLDDKLDRVLTHFGEVA
jgi:ubiquinone biosynthesis protein UbiJ